MKLCKVLTIDPGIDNRTGWAYFNEKKIPLASGIVKAPKLRRAYSWEERCFFMSNAFCSLVKTVSPEKVYIEFPAFWSGSFVSYAAISTGGLFKLAFLVGCYGASAHGLGCKVNLLSPMAWKGSMSKDVVDRRILRAIGQKFPDHVSDAVGMGLSLMKIL